MTDTKHDPVFGCLLWTGPTNDAGYPIRWQGNRAIMVTTEVNIERHGPMPKDMEVDHLCRRRLCLLDAHHERVSRSENEKRKRWSYRARRTKCAQGHSLSMTAMVTEFGGRVCRVCSKPNGSKR